MTCAWTEFLSVLPEWIRKSIFHTQNDLKELRLRVGQIPETVPHISSVTISRKITTEDLNYCINAASRYSPWNTSSIANGYITGPGGHRIGICGTVYYQNGIISGIREISSLCIRVARDLPGIAEELGKLPGSVLIIGAPGWGKTTLLRDLIRQRSNRGEHISVVDERYELFPLGHYHPGRCTDILSGCAKFHGIGIVLRTMGPDCIAVDEITSPEDCKAIIQAANCGVSLLATAHAASMREFQQRELYKSLIKECIFETIIILHPDQSWHMERSISCCTNGSVQF